MPNRAPAKTSIVAMAGFHYELAFLDAFPLGYTVHRETSSNNYHTFVSVIFRVCGGMGGLEASGHASMPYANEDLQRGRRKATAVGAFYDESAGEYGDVQSSRFRDDRHQQVLGHHSG